MKNWRIHIVSSFLSLGMLAGLPAESFAQRLGSSQAILRAPDAIIPLQIDQIVLINGQLIAVGVLGGETFAVPVDLGIGGGQGSACPILALELGAIHLDLLGLVVDTSDICLDITAVPGDLLGDLLCEIAGLLDQGGLLGDILGGLTDSELNTLLTGLTDLLNQILGLLTGPSSIVGVSGTGVAQINGACDVLNLALGPLSLNLLGLQVDLDDCAGGPVRVDITAEPGEGRLLGNLLCSLADLLNGASDRAIDRLVGRITRVISRMIG